MSGTRVNKGINILPKPEINTGMRKKKIITKAWAVVITLKKWLLKTKLLPHTVISNRSNHDIIPPSNPAPTPRIIYKLPISL